MLEHLTKADAIKFLDECARLLKPKGILVVELPLVDLIIKEWENDERVISCLYGLQRYPGDQHQYGYTKSTIMRLLLKNFNIFNSRIGRTGYNDYKIGMIFECQNFQY